MKYQVSPNLNYKQFSELPSLNPSDTVDFERGYIYDKLSLTSKSGITLGAFGAGANPKVSIMETASSFTDLGAGLWSFPADTNILLIDGLPRKKGRFPKNESEYYNVTFDSVNDFTINHASLPFSASGQVVIRLQSFITNTYDVVSDSTNVLTYVEGSGQYLPKAGYGFSLQNQVQCLTEVGDWMCVSGIITIYLGTQSPNEFIFKYPTDTNSLTITNCSNITLSGIDFEGGREDVGLISSSQNITIIGSNVKFGSGMGIKIIGNSVSDSITFSSCIATHCFAGGFYSDYLIDNVEAINCEAYDIGMIEGSPSMNGDSKGNGFSLQSGTNCLIDNCRAERIGFNGFAYLGNGTRVINSVAKYFCGKKEDGGGFYTYGIDLDITVDMELDNNIALYGIGNINGTPSIRPNCQGFYFDDDTEGVVMTNCLSAFNPIGLYIHNSNSCQFLGNTFYSNKRQLNIVQDSLLDIINLVYTGNNHITTEIDQEMAFIYGTKPNIANYGTFSNNTYSNFNTLRPVFGTWDGSEPKPFRYEISLNDWAELIGETLITYDNYENLHYSIVEQLRSINYQTTNPSDFGSISGATNSRDANGMTISKASVTKSEGFLAVGQVFSDKWYLVFGEATGNFDDLGQDFETNYISPSSFAKNLKIHSEIFELPIYSTIDREFQQLSLYQEKDFTSITFRNIAISEIEVPITISLSQIIINENLKVWDVYLDGIIPDSEIGEDEIVRLNSLITEKITIESKIR